MKDVRVACGCKTPAVASVVFDTEEPKPPVGIAWTISLLWFARFG